MMQTTKRKSVANNEIKITTPEPGIATHTPGPAIHQSTAKSHRGPCRPTKPKLNVDPVFIRVTLAAPYLGIGRNKLYQLEAEDPDFPTKIRLSSRCAGYRKQDLDAWLDKKLQQEESL
jgi:predicted DNA-binding transcriptional regulator AlpA